MIGYISLVKDNGKRAWIRADEIAAVSENEAKVDGQMVPCTTVLLRNNVAWHFPGITPAALVKLVAAVTGGQVNVFTESDI
jgi:hypothetical protein